MTDPYDLIVVGAGPVGLSTALHARRRDLRTLVLDKGAVANHLLEFPTGMSFFTPRHSLEVLGVPFDSARQHATREEIISYYTRLARLARLEIHRERTFEGVTGADGAFTVLARGPDGPIEYRCRKLVIATGVFGRPRRLDPIPGSDHPKVTYLYREPYRFVERDVLIVGAGNSAASIALALYHVGARVTVLDRNAEIPPAKWRWHLDDLQALLRAGAIRVLHRAALRRVEGRCVVVKHGDTEVELPNDDVIAMLGYEPDFPLLERVGVRVDPSTHVPAIDPRTLETSRRGVYLAGIVCAGTSPDRIFVWGARHHPEVILRHVLGEPPLDEIRDLGIETIAHWAQFEALEEHVDDELMSRLVPVATGEIADDFFDVYSYATRSVNLYAETPARAEQARATIGPLLAALDGWLLARNPDGSVVYKGQRLSADAFEILKLCDGSRTVADIAAELAASYEQDAAELRALVLALIVPLLRSGKLVWRSEPTPRAV